jgi:DNA-directed RNA polymerase specialized sigma24 family protein
LGDANVERRSFTYAEAFFSEDTHTGGVMSLLARLAPHLPYVRRYARALTGDQTTGDHYVRVALEALAAGERSLDANLSPRVALYRVFHAIWLSARAPSWKRRRTTINGGR